MLSVKAFFTLIFTFFISLSSFLAPYLGIIEKGGKDKFFDGWTKEQQFKTDYCVNLEKEADKDFVILNLTDIQLNSIEAFDQDGEVAKKMIAKLIEENDPDLITLTGDNATGATSYLELIKWIDSYNIPWAPVMGNHDGEIAQGEFWCAYSFYNAKNCLFKFGPKEMGFGNYIINITENGKIIHTLFMMDSHDYNEEKNINGPGEGGYDHFWNCQFDWYEWAVKGIESVEGETVTSTIFMHIPFYEYKTAYEEAYDKEGKCYIGEYALTSFGENREEVCCAPENNGFFEFMQGFGSTKYAICGHDHVNNSSIVYQGVRLTYGLKTGRGSYNDDDMTGGTIIKIDSTGTATTDHFFVDPNSVL